MSFDKEIFNALNALNIETRLRFDKKCEFEWKFSFGIWAGISTLIGISGKTGMTIYQLPLAWRIAFLLAIFVVHLVWLTWIQGSLNRYRDDMRRLRYEIDTLLKWKGDQQPSPDGETPNKRGYLSPTLQLIVTLFLGSILFFMVRIEAPAPDKNQGSAAARGAVVCRDSHELLDAILWMQNSAEYAMLCNQGYARARESLAAALADADWTAALEQAAPFGSKPPAIVLDIDETVLDNTRYEGQLIADRRTFDDPLWSEWVAKIQAPGVPGAAEFLAFAAGQSDTKGNKVKIIYVTNRGAASEAATRDNLKKANLPIDDDPDSILSLDERPEWKSDKGSRRRYVAEKYRVLLLIGDDLGDFVSVAGSYSSRRNAVAGQYREQWNRKWILLPNPAYGSWETSIVGSAAAGGEHQALRRKFSLVDAF